MSHGIVIVGPSADEREVKSLPAKLEEAAKEVQVLESIG